MAEPVVTQGEVFLRDITPVDNRSRMENDQVTGKFVGILNRGIEQAGPPAYLERPAIDAVHCSIEQL